MGILQIIDIAPWLVTTSTFATVAIAAFALVSDCDVTPTFAGGFALAT